MAEADDRLKTTLGDTPPASVLALAPDQRTALADLLDASRKAQSASLEQAFQESLKYVPFPLRKIVKKVLFG